MVYTKRHREKNSFFDSDKMRGIILVWLVVALCGVWRGILFTLKRSHTFIPLLLFFAVWLNSGRVACGVARDSVWRGPCGVE